MDLFKTVFDDDGKIKVHYEPYDPNAEYALVLLSDNKWILVNKANIIW